MTVDGVLTYLSTCLLATGRQLLWLLGPLLFFALTMHYCSHLIRTRAATALGANCYVWLTMPGTVAHELGHAFFCCLFGHRIVGISLFRPGGKGALGYVKHSYNRKNLYHNLGNFFIGTGPIWFGSALILLSIYWLAGEEVLRPLRLQLPTGLEVDSRAGLAALANLFAQALGEALRALLDPTRLGDWRIYLLGYLVFALGSHVTLSPEDLRGAWQGLLVGILLLLAFNLATFWYAPWSLEAARWLAPELLMAGAALLPVLVGNLLLALGAVLLVRS